MQMVKRQYTVKNISTKIYRLKLGIFFVCTPPPQYVMGWEGAHNGGGGGLAGQGKNRKDPKLKLNAFNFAYQLLLGLSKIVSENVFSIIFKESPDVISGFGSFTL